MVPKKGIDASAGSRSNSDESQNLKAIGAFRDFLENKSGKRIYRQTIPLRSSSTAAALEKSITTSASTLHSFRDAKTG